MADWRERAACLGKGDAFFPDPSDTERVAKAEAICRYCPVIENCRALARANREESGVWAGKLRGKK
jgi:hypothetical protein